MNIEDGIKIGKKLQQDEITTSQIRKFLSAVNSVANRVQKSGEILEPKLADEIQYLRVKLAYQAGREERPKNYQGDFSMSGLHFLQKVLDEQIKGIGNSKSKFESFNKLVETIVAYHKFYGGK